MKKTLIAFLLASSCAFAIAAVGCTKNKGTSSESSESYVSDNAIGETHTVTFTEGEGYRYISDTKSGEEVPEGNEISFTVDVGAFYTGSPVVFINGKVISPTSDRQYNVTVSEDLEITVTGVYEDVSDMPGTGAFDDAFIVSKPIDLLYIAQQVNKGVRAYVTGAYILANDIDCKGEELEIIGNYQTENAYFAGCFSTETDSETGETTRHTISNFTIHSEDSNYVGLFGAVMVDLSVTSSGLFYGVCLDNFTINASIDKPVDSGNLTITAGSLIGYGIGARILLCDATNGTINVYADDAYFSFVGGLMGYQQGVFNQNFNRYLPSEIAYSAVDVDVNVLKGAALYGGGISGYLTTNYPFAAAYVHNSYSTGSISGAIRAGGIAGGLGQYTSVSNCYATGEIIAKSSQTLELANEDTIEYCHAYAGGLIGFAENDTIVNDSFFAGTTAAYASAGANYQHAAPFLAGAYPTGYASATAEKGFAFQCYEFSQFNTVDALIKALDWKSYNWIVAGDYPTINYEPTATSVTTTLKRVYLAKNANGELVSTQVDGLSELALNYLSSSEDTYVTIGESFAAKSIPFYVTADNGYLSYGYYLDETCTLKMPYSYLATSDIVLYVAFADPTPVVGEYSLAAEHTTRSITLTLTKEGEAIYTDGATTRKTTYLYNGESVTIENARLARYYLGAVNTDDSASEDTYIDGNFDPNRYNDYNYKAVLDNGVLKIYDGLYFTATAPLCAYSNAFRGEYYTANNEFYTFYGATGTLENADGFAEFNYTVSGDTIRLTFANNATTSINKADLLAFDAFKGVWTKAATINKTLTIDGMGGWTYSYVSYTRNNQGVTENVLQRLSGEYTVGADGLSIALDNGWTAIFNSDGILEVSGNNNLQLYYQNGSNLGTWFNKSQGVTLTLNGLNESGFGNAQVSYTGGYSYPLTYENSETEGYLVLYSDDLFFGYATYALQSNTLSAYLFDPNNADTGYTLFTLFLKDNFDGEWISNDPAFENVDFNGEGLYNLNYANMSGSIVINGEDVPVAYTLTDSTMTGQFAYNGVLYTLAYEEDANVVTISANNSVIVLERKDVFANYTFVDVDGNEFIFDGKGNLTGNGTFTLNDKKYGYKAQENSFIVYDNGEEIGSIVENEDCYTATIADKTYLLYIKHDLMGEWAISGQYDTLTVGAKTLKGEIMATFLGNDVMITEDENGMLQFSYYDNRMPITYFIYIIDEQTLALTQYGSLLDNDYLVCVKADELFGVWTWNLNEDRTVTFDGVQSPYANGQAIVRQGKAYSAYYYRISEDGILLWSQELLTNKTLYFKIVMTDDITNENAYVKGDQAFFRIEVDALYMTEAKDANGVTYVFDGGSINGEVGTLTADNGKTYQYVVKSYNSDSTATLQLTDENGNVLEATLDYGNSENITLIIYTETETV